MSPDSIELVKTASEQGYHLTQTGKSSLLRIQYNNENNNYKDIEKLCLIEFNSDRKRETIIVKDNNLIKLYIKGADSIIEDRLCKDTKPEILEKCKHYVNKFSSQGYRTLYIGMKILTQNEYDIFINKIKEADMDLENKDRKLQEIYSLIEKDIFLIGATIVEDKLQDQVPETIRNLRLAGIKIWMLTGDKMNTAYNIALSCNLINKNLKVFEICGIEIIKNENFEDINKEERNQIIINFAKEYNKYKSQFNSMTQNSQIKFGLLIDEKALLTINDDIYIQKIFLNIAKDAIAVICCRVSPLQKSQIVKMIKNYDKNKITLAIGDGGNDVSMIMEAHIGIGIYGEEGMRAVQSSDFAIGEFKILYRLLCFHGRINYIRNSQCICYFFYKNFVFTMIQYIMGFWENFSGQTIIDDWFITLYNLIFTSLPLGVRACLDFDVKMDDGNVIYKMTPWLYMENRDYPIFTVKKFVFVLLKGILHCIINFFVVIFVLENQSVNDMGDQPCLWFISVDLYSNILIIVSLDLFIFTKYHTCLNFVILLFVTFI